MKIVALVCACLTPVAAAGDGAKDIFDAAVKKLAADTRSVQIAFHVEFSGSSKGEIKGTFAALRGNEEGAGDKIRLEFSGSVDDKKGMTLIVSNGKKMKIVETDCETIEKNVPKKLQENILTMSLCGGMVFGPNVLGNVSSEQTYPRITGFTMGSAEKVEGKETRVVEFDVASSEESQGKCHTKLIVDAATNIPLKIVVKIWMSNKTVTVTETWKEVKLNAEIAEKAFDLP